MDKLQSINKRDSSVFAFIALLGIAFVMSAFIILNSIKDVKNEQKAPKTENKLIKDNKEIALVQTMSSPFSEGFAQGYIDGYCYGYYNCFPPIPPIAPIAPLGLSEYSYKDGYNTGFAYGYRLTH